MDSFRALHVIYLYAFGYLKGPFYNIRLLYLAWAHMELPMPLKMHYIWHYANLQEVDLAHF